MIIRAALLFTTLLLTTTSTLWSQSRSYRMPSTVDPELITPNKVVVKTKPGTTASSKSFSSKKVTIKSTQKAIRYLSKGTLIDHPLNDIYLIETGGEDLELVINELLQDENVIYAEPYFRQKPLFTPNDPMANPNVGMQDYLSVIRAYDAWTVERGDSSIVIGMLDSGVQLDHPDLIDQIAYNFNDPVDGFDNDGDGLVDNFRGWDIADNDNAPEADSDNHGTLVAGVSSARTNNNEGIAGTGFHSKFLPIKIYTSEFNTFNNGYEAIAMAADMGCKVINLSWGAVGTYSQFAQDVINYAALEKDVVIVAAAGNTNAHLDFYPASYDHVLSVGATSLDDSKTNFSTYSYNIDVMAPGNEIFTTENGGIYKDNESGTSFSSPMVAGAAALVRARFPELTALQVIERLRVNTDDIYSVGNNATYLGKLGSGRLNMLNALVNNASPALRITKNTTTTSVDGLIYAADSVTLNIDVTNYLTTATGASATISAESPYITLIDSVFQIGTLSTLQSISNMQAPFRFVTSPDLPPDEPIVLRVDFESGSYADFQYIELASASNYVDLQSGDMSLTIAGDGDLGYDLESYANGNGLLFDGELILQNMGIIIAYDSAHVFDNAPNDLVSGERDEDFISLTFQKQFANSYVEKDIRSSFTIADSLLIEQKSIAENSDFIIQEYRVTNTGQNSMEFKLGLFADWQLGNMNQNQAYWEGTDKLGYVTDGTTYAGIALITSQDSIYSAINNVTLNGNAADIPLAITDSVKYAHLSQGILQEEAGANNTGNDVSHLVGAEISSLDVNSSTKVTYVFVVGQSLAELQSLVEQAKALYSNYQQNPPLITISETCLNETANINPEPGDQFAFFSDPEGVNLLFEGEEFTTEVITGDQSYYVINKDNPWDSDIYQVIARPKMVAADFNMSSNPLLLDETGNTTVNFEDTSIDGVAWQWTFGNGFTSTAENPAINFNIVGDYEVTLEVTSDLGCIEMTSKTLTVANRSNLPDINDVEICKNEEVTFSASNATNLEFYNAPDLTQLISAGSSYNARFARDTVIYAISVDSVFRSNVRAINIDVDEVTAAIDYAIDTVDLSSVTLLNLREQSTNEALNIWYAGNELLSTLPTFTYNYEGLSEINLTLVAESLNACKDSTTLQLTIQETPTPTVETLAICSGETVTVNFESPTYCFYSDANLTDLLKKGSFFQMEGLTSDTTIYVTSLASLGESESAALDINISQLSAAFQADLSPLNLAVSNQVVFTSTDPNANSWLWTIDADSIGNTAAVAHTFNSLGTYEVTLNVENSLGCTAQSTLDYEVINITSSEELSELIIYPNPASSYVQIEGQQPIEVQLLTSDGKILVETNERRLNLNEFSSGVYYLKVIQQRKSLVKRIIIQKD